MTAYRTSTPHCPQCSEPLEAHTVKTSAATVDLCERCGGAWIDWEDGDLTELARAIPPAKGRTLPSSGLGPCPRCNTALSVETIQDTAEVLRCPDCAGAFVPYPSIGKIAGLTPAQARDDDPKSALDRAIGALRSFLRGH